MIYLSLYGKLPPYKKFSCNSIVFRVTYCTTFCQIVKGISDTNTKIRDVSVFEGLSPLISSFFL